MKPKHIILFVAFVHASLLLSAQADILKTIGANAKTTATTKAVETANKTIDKILDGGIFKKKAKAAKLDSSTAPAEQSLTNSGADATTQLIVHNTDYASVAALGDLIKSNKSVKDVQRTFSNGSGIVNVTHTCKTEDVLDEILKSAAGKYEVSELSTGKIVLKAKQ